MSTTITLAHNYGYTVSMAVASIALTVFFGARVTSVRETAKVPLPFLYADQAEALEDHKKYIFNCYQRVHQNTLETFPSYLVLLLFAGAWYPLIATGFGAVWFLGRVFYFIGYTSGDPERRLWGTFGHIGELGLLGLSIKVIYDIFSGTIPPPL
ncbi:Microsomal glutathione S-transferase 3 [Podila epigama]|nr:Microsomal glutathione S-transferase 3 [Podila epigama]